MGYGVWRMAYGIAFPPSLNVFFLFDTLIAKMRHISIAWKRATAKSFRKKATNLYFIFQIHVLIADRIIYRKE